MDYRTINFYDSISHVADYAGGGLFPDAKTTQTYVLQLGIVSEFPPVGTQRGTLYEFHSAPRHRWAEWVSSATPFGDEAIYLQRLIECNYSHYGPLESSASRFSDWEEAAKAIQLLILKIHIYGLDKIAEPKCSLIQKLENHICKKNIQDSWRFEHLGDWEEKLKRK